MADRDATVRSLCSESPWHTPRPALLTCTELLSCPYLRGAFRRPAPIEPPVAQQTNCVKWSCVCSISRICALGFHCAAVIVSSEAPQPSDAPSSRGSVLTSSAFTLKQKAPIRHLAQRPGAARSRGQREAQLQAKHSGGPRAAAPAGGNGRCQRRRPGRRHSAKAAPAIGDARPRARPTILHDGRRRAPCGLPWGY